MSRYYTRRMDPRSKLQMIVMKLIKARADEGIMGSIKYTLPRTQKEIYVKPHWISEAW